MVKSFQSLKSLFGFAHQSKGCIFFPFAGILRQCCSGEIPQMKWTGMGKWFGCVFPGGGFLSTAEAIFSCQTRLRIGVIILGWGQKFSHGLVILLEERPIPASRTPPWLRKRGPLEIHTGIAEYASLISIRFSFHEEELPSHRNRSMDA